MVDTLIYVLIVLIVAGLFIYLVDLLPIDGTLKLFGKIIIILIAIVYAARRAGLM